LNTSDETRKKSRGTFCCGLEKRSVRKKRKGKEDPLIARRNRGVSGRDKEGKGGGLLSSGVRIPRGEGQKGEGEGGPCSVCEGKKEIEGTGRANFAVPGLERGGGEKA